MKKRKNFHSAAPGSSSGRHLFAPHAKRGPADRFPATAILGTGIVLSAATLVSSLVFYFHPLDFSNTRKSPAVAADSTAPPEDTAETGPGGGEAMPEPESASGADSGPGTAGGDGPRVVGSDETEDPDAPHEVGQMRKASSIPPFWIRPWGPWYITARGMPAGGISFMEVLTL